MSYLKRNIKYRNIKSYARTSTIIFTLFDAFITPRAGEISVRGLVHLLKPLGFSENAIRLVLSRMTKQGFVRSCRSGRVSYYSLTTRGSAAVESGKKSTSEMETKKWDRTWYFVVYTVPEQKRNIRDSLRTVLKGLGYGSLGGSLWVSPYGFTPILGEQVKKLHAAKYVETFRARYTGSSDLPLLAGRIWDIQGLSERYGAFMKKYQQIHDEFTIKINKGISVEPARCFAERFRVATEYIDIALDDPMLPKDMLPVEWIGRQAKELAHDVKVLLKDRADEYVNMIMQQGVVRSIRGRST
jgi:phenylacetic acid degradation operon negative regulatory protein